jgi:hypothetical protein
VLEVVGPSLGKVRVPKSRILPTRREWDKASSSDMKGFGVRRSGTFRWGGYQVCRHIPLSTSHMVRLSPVGHPSVLFGSRGGGGGVTKPPWGGVRRQDQLE